MQAKNMLPYTWDQNETDSIPDIFLGVLTAQL